MNCDETNQLIHAYIDDELDLVRSLEFEQHLRDCTACTQAHQSLQALREVLRVGDLYQKPGAHLKRRIQRALRQASGVKTARPRAPWRTLAIAASLAAAVFLTWGGVHVLSVRFTEDRMAREVVSSHVRSIMAITPIDQQSSDHHVLKPWLNDKLGFSPDVADAGMKPDLAEHEFTLEGARVDYLDDRLVAALVYKRAKHLVNLFVWPSAEISESDLKTVSRKGYHLYHWIASGMNYWVVSDLNDEALQQFVRLIRD